MYPGEKAAGGSKGKGLYPGWDKDLHYAVSLDFFKTPAAKIVPCGNLFEARPDTAPRPAQRCCGCRGRPPSACAGRLHDQAWRQAVDMLPRRLFTLRRLWPARFTWRCRLSALWGRTARPARLPKSRSAGAQVGVADGRKGQHAQSGMDGWVAGAGTWVVGVGADTPPCPAKAA